MSRIYLVATGSNLVGRGIRSIQSVMEEMLLEAEDEIIIAAYTISGNLRDFFQLLWKAAARGVRILMIINHIESQPRDVRKILDDLSSEFPHVRIYDFTDETCSLHMKVVAVDRKKALIGSANLTWKGMVENLELGIVVEGELAETVSRVLEDLTILWKLPKLHESSSDNSRYS